MTDAGLGALLIRTVVSLAIVLAVIAIAYAVAKRRRGQTGVSTAPARRVGRRRSQPAAVEIVGRVGLNRGTAVIAIRFGDRVLLVSSSEQGGTNTLAEMPAVDWDELHTVREPLDRTAVAGARPEVVTRPSFVEALRQATARHA